jgi:hypothetical protein
VPKKPATKRSHSVSACAEELNLSVELIRDYSMRGCPHTKGGPGKSNLYNPDEVAAWMVANKLTGKPGRPTDGDSDDIEAAKLREINLRCRKHELFIGQQERELVPAVDVAARWVELVTTAKNKLSGLGAGVAPQCEGHDAGTIQGIIESRVNEILVELSRTD